MATRARSRKEELIIFGLRPETLQEIGGIFLFLLGLGGLLAVISIEREENLIGPLGAAFAGFLCLSFGQFLACALPVMVMTFGVATFRGWKLRHPFIFSFGLLLIIFSTSGLIGQLATQLAEQETVRLAWAGVLGVFLVDERGLALTKLLGGWGGYGVFVGGVTIGLLLTSHFLFNSLFRGLKAGWIVTKNALKRKLPLLNKLKSVLFHFQRDDERVSRRYFVNTEEYEKELVKRTGTASPQTKAASSRARIASSVFKPIELPIDDELELEELEVEEPATRRRKSRTRKQKRRASASQVAESNEGVQEEFNVFQGYQLPLLEQLSDPPPSKEKISDEELIALSERLESVLNEFNISSQVVKVTQGPTVTMFELRTAPGVKVSRITALENDIAMALKALSVRILAPVPGRGTVGIEVPNSKPDLVYLKEILASDKFRKMQKPLVFALGKTVQGDPMVCDLAKMPHLLIAGATGSGKSVCLNSIICSLLFTQKPDRVKFLMIDPKKVELNVYQDIPHLLAPVVSEPRKAAAALAWVVTEMEDRYERLKLIGERNIDAYNQVAQGEKPLHSLGGQNNRPISYMPHIVVIVDELADLMLMLRKEIEENVTRLAQMSRAVGIHLILATQRPSVNVITGIIKANFPTRAAFQVASQVDSKTILDGKGAESLLGQGDMLFLGGSQRKAVRIQGAFIADEEVEALTNFIRGQECVKYVAGDFQPVPEAPAAETSSPKDDSSPTSGEAPPEATMTAVAAAIAAEDLVAPDDDARVSPDTHVSATTEGPPETSPPRTRASHYMVEDFPTDNETTSELEDELYRDALKLIILSKKASVSLIQRRLKIGYARAGRLMDIIEAKGIVGPYCGSKPRQFLLDPEEALRRFKNGDL